jgi:hypothetical protein
VRSICKIGMSPYLGHEKFPHTFIENLQHSPILKAIFSSHHNVIEVCHDSIIQDFNNTDQ